MGYSRDSFYRFVRHWLRHDLVSWGAYYTSRALGTLTFIATYTKVAFVRQEERACGGRRA